MKIILKESQYKRVILEQPENKMDRSVGIERTNMRAMGLNPSSHANIQTYNTQVYGKPFTGHEVATILQIGTAFIPVIGPFISSGIGFLEAKSYWDEGNKQEATLVAIFSSLPLIGSIVSKIPGVKQLGQKGMSLLASKLVKGGGKNLSKAESEVASAVAKYSPEIKEELKKLAPKLKSIIKDVETYKSNYIKKYGVEEYNSKLFRYLYGDSPKEEFVRTLKSASKAPNIKVKPVLGGGKDHRVFQSTVHPDRIIKAELRPGEVDTWYKTFKSNEKIFPKVFNKTKVKDETGQVLSAVVLEKLNTRAFESLWDDISKEFYPFVKNSGIKYPPELETVLKNINENSTYKKLWTDFVKNSKSSISGKLNEFSKLVDEVYKITPKPDIRKFNFGYDTKGVLKVLDLFY